METKKKQVFQKHFEKMNETSSQPQFCSAQRHLGISQLFCHVKVMARAAALAAPSGSLPQSLKSSRDGGMQQMLNGRSQTGIKYVELLSLRFLEIC